MGIKLVISDTNQQINLSGTIDSLRLSQNTPIDDTSITADNPAPDIIINSNSSVTLTSNILASSITQASGATIDLNSYNLYAINSTTDTDALVEGKGTYYSVWDNQLAPIKTNGLTPSNLAEESNLQDLQIPIPENLSYTLSNNDVILTWDTIPNVTYCISRSKTVDDINLIATALSLATLTDPDTSDIDNCSYYYRVATFGGPNVGFTRGDLRWSQPITVPRHRVKVWSGQYSTAFEEPSNWADGRVPATKDDILIPYSTENRCVISSVSGFKLSLGTITVQGSLDCFSSLQFLAINVNYKGLEYSIKNKTLENFKITNGDLYISQNLDFANLITEQSGPITLHLIDGEDNNGLPIEQSLIDVVDETYDIIIQKSHGDIVLENYIGRIHTAEGYYPPKLTILGDFQLTITPGQSLLAQSLAVNSAGQVVIPSSSFLKYQKLDYTN